ncbi:Lysosome membrane protein 2 [Aphelenchoides bicaudatus]|nr:Lysosome membrane protein 2 [Aphelenchoides bicaudatus]
MNSTTKCDTGQFRLCGIWLLIDEQKRLSGCVWFIISAILLALALICFITATFGLLLTPSVIHQKILESAKWGFDKRGKPTATTKAWENPKYKMFFQVNVFSVLNAEEVNKTRTTMPLFEERGPYSFKEYRHNKYEMEEKELVTYQTKKTYIFDPDTSCEDCYLDDYVTVVNFPLQVMQYTVMGDILSTSVLNGLLENTTTTAFKRVKVRKLLFDGYDDELLLAVKEAYPKMLNTTRAGLFLGKNGTYNAPITVNTGSKNINEIGKVYFWNYSSTTDAWYKPEAQEIHGVDGQFFPPKKYGHLDKFEIFVGDICRAVKFKHNDTVYFDNLLVDEYLIDNSMGDPDEEQRLGYCNPNSARFFDDPKVQPAYCSPVGLLDIESCQPLAKGFLFGQPHFKGSPDEIRQMVAGIRKPKSREVTRIQIESQTGVLVFAQQLTQINIGAINGDLAPLNNLTSRVMPIIWLNETVVYDKETAKKLHQLSNIQWIIFDTTQRKQTVLVNQYSLPPTNVVPNQHNLYSSISVISNPATFKLKDPLRRSL